MKTIKDIFETASLLYSEKIMFSTYHDEQYTFSQFKEKVYEMQNTLYYYGVEKGSKVAILAEDTLQWNVAFFAITTMGGIVVPISKYKDAATIHRTTSEADCKYLILENSIISSKTANEINEDTPLTIIDIDTLKCVISPNLEIKRSLTIDNSHSLTRPEVNIDTLDIAAIEVTIDPYAASTKYFTHEELISEASKEANSYNLTESDIFLSVLTVSTIFRKLTGSLIPIMSGTATIFKPRHAFFNEIMDMITDTKPSVVYTVSKVIELVYKSQIVSNRSKMLNEREDRKLSLFQRLKLKATGIKLHKVLGGNIRVCATKKSTDNKKVESFIKKSGLRVKMKFINGQA